MSQNVRISFTSEELIAVEHTVRMRWEFLVEEYGDRGDAYWDAQIKALAKAMEKLGKHLTLPGQSE